MSEKTTCGFSNPPKLEKTCFEAWKFWEQEQDENRATYKDDQDDIIL